VKNMLLAAISSEESEVPHRGVEEEVEGHE
jgi:hypothetical protein